MSEQQEMERDKILAVIQGLEFFQGFSEYEKKRVAAMYAHFSAFWAGETIIEEGSFDTAFFILIHGRVSVVKKGVLSPIASLNAGEFFGEMAFLTDMPRTANVVADERSLVLRVDQELLGRLGSDIRLKIKDRIIAKLVVRLADMTRRFTEVSPESF